MLGVTVDNTHSPNLEHCSHLQATAHKQTFLTSLLCIYKLQWKILNYSMGFGVLWRWFMKLGGPVMTHNSVDLLGDIVYQYFPVWVD